MRLDDVENKRLCFVLCSKFVKEVLSRLQQYVSTPTMSVLWH